MSKKGPMKCTVKNSYGESIAADQDGNNVAFICQNCGYPVLMSQHIHPNGEIHCRGCEHEYRVNWPYKSEEIIITYKGQACNLASLVAG